MPRPAPPPALVAVAAAFFAGATLAGPFPTVRDAVGVATACGLAAWLARRSPRARTILLATAAAACSAASQGAGWSASLLRQEAWFVSAAPVECDLTATVLEAPERARRGERWLRLRIEGEGHPSLTARLVVAEPGEDEAARLDALRFGDRVVVWCRIRPPARGPGRSADAARRALWSQGLDATGSVKSSRLVRLAAPGEGGIRRAIDDLRARARAALDRALTREGRSRAVLGAMLLGDRGLTDDETNRVLRDSGLVHLLSISGLHTAIALVVVMAILRRIGSRPPALAGIAALAILALCAFVGGGSPVLRSGVMVLAALLARAVGREIDALSALALATTLLVATMPRLAWDVSFQLSVLATAGLLALGPPIARVVPGPRWLAKGLGVSAGAYLATAPTLAVTFGRLAPVSLAANLAAGVLCAAALAAGAGVLVLGSVPVIGPAIVAGANLSVSALCATAQAAAAIPGGHRRVAAPAPSIVALDLALLLAIVALPAGRARRRLAAVLAIVTIALHLGPRPSRLSPSRLDVLDVGQGLAVVLEVSGEIVVVDAGPGEPGRFDAGERLVVPAILARGERRVSILALSHGHADHIGGAPAILQDLEVGEVWFPAGSEHDPPMRRVLDLAREKGAALRRMRRGDRIARGGWALEALHPADADRRGPINDRCLVLKLRSSEGSTALLPGDLEAPGEAALVLRGSGLEAQALVVPHHGADGSSGGAFLRAVVPEIAIVSAGAGNRFGHPGPRALRRLERCGARVHRTDRAGTITLTATSAGWDVSEDLQGDRDEGEDEHERERSPDQPPRPVERGDLVDQAGMTPPEDQENDEPERIPRDGAMEDRLPHHEDREGGDRDPRNGSMERRAHREDGVTSIELPDRKQVQGGHEHADPRRAVDRSHLQVGVPVQSPLEQPRDQRRAEEQPVRLGHVRRRVGEGDPDREDGKRDREPRDRTGGRDVE